jgi:hypothetical protein
MATEAPTGNREIDEEPWTAERVRQNDERRTKWDARRSSPR